MSEQSGGMTGRLIVNTKQYSFRFNSMILFEIVIIFNHWQWYQYSYLTNWITFIRDTVCVDVIKIQWKINEISKITNRYYDKIQYKWRFTLNIKWNIRLKVYLAIQIFCNCTSIIVSVRFLHQVCDSGKRQKAHTNNLQITSDNHIKIM